MNHMKTLTSILFSALLFMVGCDDATSTVALVSPVEISFAGLDNTNLVQVAEGDTAYTAKINVTSANNIHSFSIYEFNIKTGVVGNLIGAKVIFTPSVSTYSAEYIVNKLTESKAIKIVIEDTSLVSYSQKLVVKITPTVMVSDLKIIETAEATVGPYYASWFNGRTYIRSNGSEFTNEIDFSLGDIAIDVDTVPAFISPDQRQVKGLLTLPDLRPCTFALTTLTKAAFDAIPLTKSTAIDTLQSPTLSAIKAETGKVYKYENATDKGLIYVSAVTAKTGIIQQADGSWVQKSKYYQLTIQTKTVLKKY